MATKRSRKRSATIYKCNLRQCYPFSAVGPGGGQAVSKLHDLVCKHGEDARRRAGEYGRVSQGRRGSMVLDVVTSRQRLYQQRVLPLVRQWEADNEQHSL